MGNFCVTLEFKILTYAQYAAVFHSSQALKSPHYKHLFGKNKGMGDFGVKFFLVACENILSTKQ